MVKIYISPLESPFLPGYTGAKNKEKEHISMKYAIVYASLTGNTRLLAETVRDSLEGTPVWFGEADPRALEADRIYVGFWTDRGSCDGATAEFLKTLTDQEVFLFGSAGFVEGDYPRQVLDRVRSQLDPRVKVVGTFFCQGRMPMSVRRRYEAMTDNPDAPRRIRNFDAALSHPDSRDLQNLRAAL